MPGIPSGNLTKPHYGRAFCERQIFSAHWSFVAGGRRTWSDKAESVRMRNAIVRKKTALNIELTAKDAKVAKNIS
jgi:hypothetical protein